MTDKVKKVLPPKPDEKSYPNPLERFAALKKWRKAVDKILGHEEVMKYDATKTTDAAEKEMVKVDEGKRAIQKGTEAIKKEIGEVKPGREIKLTRVEQLAELKRIRKKNKRLRDKKAQEEAKKINK